ncbi:hypothetical protein [Microbacterium sp. ProA8]|jgi:hypothetical protein|uniref:hypothetical protein n=1 Tax=Microbacterium chionoecetis TaxID=3153754 RepID=UPI0032633CC4
MGLFSQRPEEPTEWAGLPSEPARAESSAERLPDAAPVDLGGLGSIGLPEFGGGGVIEAIVIPVTPVAGSDAAAEPDSND